MELLKILSPVSLPARRVFAAGCFRVGAEMPLVSDTPVGNRFFERHTEGIVPGMIPQPFLIF